MRTTERRRTSPSSRERLRIAGVMTGTSCDGIDVACVEFDSSGNWHPSWVRSRPFARTLRRRVLAAQEPVSRLSARDWLALDRDLGEWIGATLVEILAGFARSDQADLLAIHGQTIAHFPPEAGAASIRERGTTWQAANLASVAVATGLTIVGQFRIGDLAVGGQGAPLMPRFHLELAHRLADASSARRQTLSFLNIGGMANFSVIDIQRLRGRTQGRVRLGYDTGPGNCWIDAAVAAATGGKSLYDQDGRLAASCPPSMDVVNKILGAHPHFNAHPPKSIGRDQLPWRIFERSAGRLKGAALISTATELTAESILLSYLRDVLPGSAAHQEILVCGGGARNPELVRRLQSKFAPHAVVVTSLDEFGWDPSALEAQGFALFGWRALLGQEQGGPWTGTAEWSPPGVLIPGRNWARIASLLPGLTGGDGPSPAKFKGSKKRPGVRPTKSHSKNR
jgi:anhydro-N-acetylmuramic acid kinase